MPGQAKGKHPGRAHIAKMRKAHAKSSKEFMDNLSGLEGTLGDSMPKLQQQQQQMAPGPIPMGGFGGDSPLGGKAR